ncbi:sugar ABC transporter ATP-binding protein [Salinibacterium sp. SYSU T00001]|uniref:sugar ABC transporter ATP-binding protein n=1 Tax=Homoserinimonas sedimenticola TaxID=2986805 RepID=UPI0022361279|nr:sugar ABC transporter ATP-binding protein [Salinibacterium sedimenticola]MCW4385187.1 sugar ABC transporter ATP-binding protein [Salinibacterium sedimenticola]
MSTPLLRVTGLVKRFPSLVALDHLDLDVHGGEVVAVVGHNGSGKSTLVKILAGAYTADDGSVALAESTDLHFIHQNLALIGELSAVENLGLANGRGAAAAAPFRSTEERARTRELIERFGAGFDIDRPVRELTPAQRAVIAISRALEGWTHPANVIVLDEPTESLHRNEVEVLFAAVRQLAAEGAGVIFVSHRLDEVLDLADRVVVLRDGSKVADEPVTEIDQARLVELITGDAGAVVGDAQSAGRRNEDAGPVLRVRGLRGATVDGLDLELYPGEVVGLAGVLGSGREAVPSLLYGAAPSEAREYTVAGQSYARRSPKASLARGIAFVPGDRGRLGAILEMSARENLTLPQLRTLTGPFGNILMKEERDETDGAMAAYQVRPPLAEQKFTLFSGGNQQKVVIARALRDDPSLLLLDEPTQGVDIGAKATIYETIDAAAARGTAVLVSSSDDKELMRLCDRVIVMRDGRMAAELSGANLTERRLVSEGYGFA